MKKLDLLLAFRLRLPAPGGLSLFIGSKMAFTRLRNRLHRFWCADNSRFDIGFTKKKILKALLNPRLLLDLLNAQIRMGLRASVPISVRLRGRIRIAGGGRVILGHAVFLLGSIVPIEIISQERARVVVGDHFFINYGTSISAHKEIIIGRRCKIGRYVCIMDNNQHDIIDRTKLPESSPVILEDNVWIGAHSIILPGVRIGRNSVVGAGSVVKHNVPPDSMVAGNPAKLKRKLRGDDFT